MEIQIAVAKVNKYAVSESGDTIETIERPNGGLSVVMADGQTSGRGAKAVSTMVVRKVVSLLAEGVRDGAAARAASDYLYTERSGKVSACLSILSVDFQSDTLVLTRNNPSPVYFLRAGRVECLESDSKPIGTSRNIRPTITELPLESGLLFVMITDGIFYAGDRYGTPLDLRTLLEGLLEEELPGTCEIADLILKQAIQLDQNRPNDDMTIVVLRAVAGEYGPIRRMTVNLPVPFHDD